jgi:hypothetical protein
MMQHSRSLNLLATLLVGAVLVFTCLRGEGKPNTKARPFKADGVAIWDDINLAAGEPGGPGAQFVGTGNSTHLGKFTQEGDLHFTGAPDDFGVVPGSGDVTFTAANGDELRFHYDGTLDSMTGIGAGTLTFTGGTGRFANATGTGEFYAEIQGIVLAPMKVWLTGSVSY